MRRLQLWALGCNCRSWWCVLDSLQHRAQMLNFWTFQHVPMSDRVCDKHDRHILGETL